MEKKTKIAITLLVISMVLLIITAIALVNSINREKRIKHVSEAYADTLTYYKLIEEANILLLENKMDESLELYAQVNRLKPLGYGWNKKVQELMGLRVFNAHVTDSVSQKLRRLNNQLIFKNTYIQKLDALNNQSYCENDSLANLLQESVSGIQLLVSTNQTLLQELAALKISFGRLEFRVNDRTVSYYGSIKSGKANGSGIGVFDSKGVYDGEWKDNLRHGTGKYTWANGDSYEGSFVEGKREGTGTYVFASGEKYSGQWRNDIREGSGIMYAKDGEILLKGNWVNDKFIRDISLTQEKNNLPDEEGQEKKDSSSRL